MREMAEKMRETRNLILSGRRWKEIKEKLKEVEGELKRLKRKSKDEEYRSKVAVLTVFNQILWAIATWEDGDHEALISFLKKVKRRASRTGYLEPRLAALSLLSAALFRVSGDDMKGLDTYIADLEEALERTEQDDIPTLLMLLEVLAYLNSARSSDDAFKYAVRYALLAKDSRGIEYGVIMNNFFTMMDAILMRLAYEVKAGKMLPHTVDWVEEANTLLDWIEGETEVPAMAELYTKVLPYAVLRSKYLEGDPLRLSDRLRKAEEKVRTFINLFVRSMGEDGEPEGGTTLKA